MALAVCGTNSSPIAQPVPGSPQISSDGFEPYSAIASVFGRACHCSRIVNELQRRTAHNCRSPLRPAQAVSTSRSYISVCRAGVETSCRLGMISLSAQCWQSEQVSHVYLK